MEHLERALNRLNKDFDKNDHQKCAQLFDEVIKFTKDNNKEFHLENIEKHIDEYLSYKFEKENNNKE